MIRTVSPDSWIYWELGFGSGFQGIKFSNYWKMDENFKKGVVEWLDLSYIILVNPLIGIQEEECMEIWESCSLFGCLVRNSQGSAKDNINYGVQTTLKIFNKTCLFPFSASPSIIKSVRNKICHVQFI